MRCGLIVDSRVVMDQVWRNSLFFRALHGGHGQCGLFGKNRVISRASVLCRAWKIPESTMSLWRSGRRSAPPLDCHGTRPPAEIMQGCLLLAPSRALFPGHDRTEGPNHSLIGLFRRGKWATAPRSGGRCAPLQAGAASGTLAGRAEVCVLPVADGILAVGPVPGLCPTGAEAAAHRPPTVVRIAPNAVWRQRVPTQQWLTLWRLGMRPAPPP